MVFQSDRNNILWSRSLARSHARSLCAVRPELHEHLRFGALVPWTAPCLTSVIS